MACRVLSTIIVIFCTLMIGLASCYPGNTDTLSTKEKEALYKEIIQLLSTKVNLPGAQRTPYREGFGAKHWSEAEKHYLNGLGWKLEKSEAFLKSNTNVKPEIQGNTLGEDIGKRDYGDLGFFFGKRGEVFDENEMPDALHRQSRDYNDMGFFFGKRNIANAANEANVEFADFAA